MVTQEMFQLINACGWMQIPSKNPYMLSFTKDERRMNVYFTTGTITIQDKDQNVQSWRNVSTNDEIETICMV